MAAKPRSAAFGGQIIDHKSKIINAVNPTELSERTMNFALRILKVTEALPRTTAGRAVASQVARSGTSVAANYRAALRAKSRADFVSKITTVLEEADESDFWLELIERGEMIPTKRSLPLRTEAAELVRIFNATRTTAKKS